MYSLPRVLSLGVVSFRRNGSCSNVSSRVSCLHCALNDKGAILIHITVELFCYVFIKTNWDGQCVRYSL